MPDTTNKDEMTAYFKECVAEAIAALPEDLRGYANAEPGSGMWSVEALYGGTWGRDIEDYAIWFQESERSDYGRTKLKVLKSGQINQDRLNTLVSIYARRKAAIKKSANTREANRAAWEAAGKPGGDSVRITDNLDDFEISFRGKSISFIRRWGVPLAQIAPVLAALEAADARVSAVLNGGDNA